MNYTRNNVTKDPTNPVAPATVDGSQNDEAPIKVNGFQQVLAMLRIADDEFRNSLLRRLAARDRELAAALLAELRKM